MHARMQASSCERVESLTAHVKAVPLLRMHMSGQCCASRLLEKRVLEKRINWIVYLDHRLRTASDLDSCKFEVLLRVYALVVPRVWYRVIVDCVLLRVRVGFCVVVAVHVTRGHFAAARCVVCVRRESF